MNGSAEDDVEDERIAWIAGSIASAASSAGIGMTVTVADDGLRNVYANGNADRLFGYEPGELLNANPLARVAAVDQGRLAHLAGEFAETGVVPKAVETSLTLPDGRSVAIDVGLGGTSMDGHFAVVAFIADATQRRRAIESLHRSEKRFRSVVESIPEAIFITEGTRLVYANPAFSATFGLGGPDVPPNFDVLGLVHRADVASIEARIAGLSYGDVAHFEVRMTPPTGDDIVLETSAIGVDLDGKLRILWLGHDVTSGKRLESKLLQADRLGVLGSLAAGMAHSINNPLSYTLLNLEHVARRLRDIGTEHDYYSEARVRLAEAHDGAERIAKVVRQMRALSRARAPEPGPVDLRVVLENVLAMVGNEIRYRGQLVTRLDPTPKVFASEGDLEQAFLGLLLYVARAASSRNPANREIRLAASADDAGSGMVTVSDDGLALGEAEKRRLFEPFSGGNETGLGLAVCHSILTSLGGRIEVEGSERGEGTVFRVTLPPAADSDVAAPSRGPKSVRTIAPTGPPEVRARVLVIDDDPGVGSALRAMLEAHHEVRSVVDGREGLKILLGPEEFDVVFCDLIMPDVSGMDVFCALELNRPERAERVVFMTGGVFTTEAERFLSRVPNPRVEKPFSLARIEQLLAQAVGKNQR